MQTRVVAMVERHDAEGFGSCSNEGECEAVCPKEIPITNIARMNREYLQGDAGVELVTTSDLDHVDQLLDRGRRLLQRRVFLRPSA